MWLMYLVEKKKFTWGKLYRPLYLPAYWIQPHMEYFGKKKHTSQPKEKENYNLAFMWPSH